MQGDHEVYESYNNDNTYDNDSETENSAATERENHNKNIEKNAIKFIDSLQH